MAETVLIAALSGRALAAAAKRAGYRPLVADLFRDLDTRRIATRSAILHGDLENGIEASSLLETLVRLSAGYEPAGFVYGAGFEDRPGLIGRVADRWPLLGNGPKQISVLKDPRQFFPLLRDLQIAHPPVSDQPPPAGETWLVKARGASGGGHVRKARAHDRPRPDRYFQKRLRGHAVSALFLANGKDARLLGSHEQWASPRRKAPFRFGGLAGPAILPPEQARQVEETVKKLAGALRLVGLNSADFIANRDGCFLLEINPRPGASLDIHDPGMHQPLFALHREACEGALPDTNVTALRAAASAVVYAPRRLTVPAGYRWPRWTADRGAPGTGVPRGAPVCTVLASARTVAAARDLAFARSATVLRAFGTRPGVAMSEAYQEGPAP